MKVIVHILFVTVVLSRIDAIPASTEKKTLSRSSENVLPGTSNSPVKSNDSSTDNIDVHASRHGIITGASRSIENSSPNNTQNQSSILSPHTNISSTPAAEKTQQSIRHPHEGKSKGPTEVSETGVNRGDEANVKSFENTVSSALADLLLSLHNNTKETETSTPEASSENASSTPLLQFTSKDIQLPASDGEKVGHARAEAYVKFGGQGQVSAHAVVIGDNMVQSANAVAVVIEAPLTNHSSHAPNAPETLYYARLDETKNKTEYDETNNVEYLSFTFKDFLDLIRLMREAESYNKGKTEEYQGPIIEHDSYHRIDIPSPHDNSASSLYEPNEYRGKRPGYKPLPRFNLPRYVSGGSNSPYSSLEKRNDKNYYNNFQVEYGNSYHANPSPYDNGSWKLYAPNEYQWPRPPGVKKSSFYPQPTPLNPPPSKLAGRNPTGSAIDSYNQFPLIHSLIYPENPSAFKLDFERERKPVKPNPSKTGPKIPNIHSPNNNVYTDLGAGGKYPMNGPHGLFPSSHSMSSPTIHGEYNPSPSDSLLDLYNKLFATYQPSFPNKGS